MYVESNENLQEAVKVAESLTSLSTVQNKDPAPSTLLEHFPNLYFITDLDKTILMMKNVVNIDMKSLWSRVLCHVTILTEHQTMSVWFWMRPFVLTSSTTYGALIHALPAMYRNADITDDLKGSTVKIADYLQIDIIPPPEPVQEEKKLTKEDIDKLTGKKLVEMIRARNTRENAIGKDKISTTGKVADLKTRVFNMIHHRQNVFTPREYITRSLLNTYFLKPLDAERKPALKKGQRNEPFIRAAIAEFVYMLSNNKNVILEMKEFGLLENKQANELCTSADGVFVFLNFQNRNLECHVDMTSKEEDEKNEEEVNIRYGGLEAKTMCTPETKEKASINALSFGLFSQCDYKDIGV